MNRRTLLATVPLAILAACSNPAAVATQVAQGLSTIGAALLQDLTQLQSIIGIPAGTIASFSSIVAAIVSTAQQVASTGLAPATGIQSIFADLEKLVAASAPLAALLPGPWTAGLAAAMVVLPTLAALVGLVLPASAAAPGFRATFPAMTADKAMELLKRQVVGE